MGDEVHLWQIGPSEQLSEISRAKLDLESRLEDWLESEPRSLRGNGPLAETLARGDRRVRADNEKAP
jgi:hypothetical protein